MNNSAPIELKIAGVDLIFAHEPSQNAEFRLSAEEERRAENFATPDLRQRWRWMRWQVRAWLGRRLCVAPQGLVWQVDDRGKPRLAGHEQLHFNLSHSGPWVGLAMSEAGAVGLDLEVIQPEFPHADVSADFYTAAEVAVLAGLGKKARLARFYAYWTAKEALMKATGLGMELDPREVSLALSADGTAVGYEDYAWKLSSGGFESVVWSVAS